MLDDAQLPRDGRGAAPPPPVMRRRLVELSSLGEIDVLTEQECAVTASAVMDAREQWVSRSGSGHFATFGINAYMDLAPSTDTDASYFGAARRSNAELTKRFADLHVRLADVLGCALDLPARYAEDLALPGFHIWLGPAIPRLPVASVHFDLQYQRLLSRPDYARSTGTMSFTLPISLPATGSSLRVWPRCTYSHGRPNVPWSRREEPEIVDYRLGRALVHSGHLLHQIGATPLATNDDVRIMLQGHGLVIDDALVLYW